MEKQPKKYLTKYLPVEGEIKEGDWYKDREGIIRQRGVKNTNHYDSYYSPLEKVKLFLCSRDIQVGDEITWIGLGSSPQTPFGTKIKHDTPLTRGRMHENWVKVIGEISPEATWVTEWMEFDEDEVKTLYDGRFLPIDHWLPNAIKRIVAVVGPCGHFH